MLFRKDRPGKHSDGVALYARQHVKYIELCFRVADESVESLSVRITGQTIKGDTVGGVATGHLMRRRKWMKSFKRQVEAALWSQVLVLTGDFSHPDI